MGRRAAKDEVEPPREEEYEGRRVNPHDRDRPRKSLGNPTKGYPSLTTARRNALGSQLPAPDIRHTRLPTTCRRNPRTASGNLVSIYLFQIIH